MASNKMGLVCCTDDQRCHGFVSSVLAGCDREDNDGSDIDDCESDCFCVSDHDSVSENGDDDRELEETRSVPLGVGNISEDFETDIEEEVKT
jgi:hypothetical protein